MNERTAQSLANLKQLPSILREAAAAAASVRLKSQPADGTASPGRADTDGRGGGRARGGGLYQRWQRSRQWQEGREASWGTQFVSEGHAPDTSRTHSSLPHGSSPHHGGGSMLYRDRYADSWERVLATVPSVFVTVGQESAALQEDLRKITSSLSPLSRQQRGGSEPPPDACAEGGSVNAGGGGASDSPLASSHLTSDMLHSTSLRGGARVNLLIDPDDGTELGTFREQLC